MTETYTLHPPQTVARSGEHVDSMLGVKQYAQHVHAGERTVRTWLADGRLERAVKLNGVWMIPADDRPVEPAAGAEIATLPQTAQHVLPQGMPQMPQGARLVDELDVAPVFLPLEHAARLLGVSEHVLRSNRDVFGVVPFGAHGSLVVPQRVVRELAGIGA